MKKYMVLVLAEELSPQEFIIITKSFFIALFIHLIPIVFLATKNTNTVILISSPKGIALNTFSYSHARGGHKSISIKSGSGLPLMAKEKGLMGTSSPEVKNAPVILQIIEPQYPPIARKREQEGKVKTKAFFNAEGIITNVEITESSGVKSLDEAVKKALSEWKLSKGLAGSFEKSFEFKLRE